MSDGAIMLLGDAVKFGLAAVVVGQVARGVRAWYSRAHQPQGAPREWIPINTTLGSISPTPSVASAQASYPYANYEIHVSSSPGLAESIAKRSSEKHRQETFPAL